MLKNILFFVFISALLAGCRQESGIEGLWVVKLVKAGDQEMTPNARWTRFYPDSTQESGNGKLAHSYGTWKLEPETGKLTIHNQNGLYDPSGPFTIRLEKNTMYWHRSEEGQEVEVTLTRASRLPETYGDQLMGLWKLEAATGNGNYFLGSDTSDPTAYAFFRWDRRFVISTERRKIHGVYNVHGHKPELELIPYGERPDRDFWNIAFDGDEITLRLLNSDSLVLRSFSRIHAFPE